MSGKKHHIKFIIAPLCAAVRGSHKHRHGTGFQVHIWLTIPSYENIVVNNSASDDARHEHAEVAIKDAFAAIRRQVDAFWLETKPQDCRARPDCPRLQFVSCGGRTSRQRNG